MKKSLKLVAILAIVCVFVGCLVGCKKVKPQYGEKYYLCYGDVMMETSWLEFDQKKWSNEMRMSGKYKISGKKIKLYLDKEVAYEGVIGDGEITLTEGGASIVYRLKEKQNENPYESESRRNSGYYENSENSESNNDSSSEALTDKNFKFERRSSGLYLVSYEGNGCRNNSSYQKRKLCYCRLRVFGT